MREIRLSGPGMNALGTALLERVCGELERAGGEPVLITGDGRAFSAGLDLAEIVAVDGEAAMRAYLERLDAATATLFDYPGPTAAAVAGHAIAGGCVLTLCCDVRVATADPRVRLGLNETALGAPFTPTILAVVRARVPRRHLHTVLLGAALHDPAEALRLGLVDVVAADAEAEVRRRLGQLAAHDPATYRVTKAALRAGVTAVPEAARERFRRDGLPLWLADGLRERARAVLGG